MSAGRRIAAVERAVAQHRAEHVAKTRPQAALEMQSRAAPVFADLYVHAVAEHGDGRIAQRIEKPHFGC